MDICPLVGIALLDLHKAFDTVDHVIMSMKLHTMGLNDSWIRWLTFYLSDKKQNVQVLGTKSASANVSSGVHLRGITFLVHVYDMSAVVMNKNLCQ